MADLYFKKKIQEEKEDERFEDSLKILGRDEESNHDWVTDDDLKVDLNELFSE